MDLFVILGLPPGAPESDIKRAYRRLARRFHPDINPGDRTAEARFRQILDAYETLMDPDRRSRYEAGHGLDAQEQARRSGFEGFDFTARGVDYSASFGDLVAEVLTERGARAPGEERGSDLHHEMALTFDEALAGVQRAVPVTRRETCRTCGGAGAARALAAGPCAACQGTGAVRTVRGHMVFSRRCNACNGTGQQRPRACETCDGSGQETRAEAVAVRVPPGIADGDRVRVAAKGHSGLRGGPAGDLFMTIRVAAHAVFRREGDDLHLVVPVGIHEAALGARIDIPSPDGPVKLRVPPGTQSGQRFRMRERGATSTRTGRRGDLVAEARLMLPTVLDERSKELLREFGRLNGEHVRDELRG